MHHIRQHITETAAFEPVTGWSLTEPSPYAFVLRRVLFCFSVDYFKYTSAAKDPRPVIWIYMKCVRSFPQVELYFGRTVEEGATYQEGSEPSHLPSFLAVKKLVAELGLPFREVEGDTAILTATASGLRRWVMETDGPDDSRNASRELQNASDESRTEVLDSEVIRGSLKSESGKGVNGMDGTASGAELDERSVRQIGAIYSARREDSGVRSVDGTPEPEGNERITEAAAGTCSANGSPRPKANRENVPEGPLPTAFGRSEDDKGRETAAQSLDDLAGMLTAASVTDSLNRESPKDVDSAHVVEQRRGEEESHTETEQVLLDSVAEKPEVIREHLKVASRATPFVRLSLKREKVVAQ